MIIERGEVMDTCEMKAVVKVVMKDGRQGVIVATSVVEDNKRFLVEFYDGRDVDPTDPMFPIYTEVTDGSDFVVVSA